MTWLTCYRIQLLFKSIHRRIAIPPLDSRTWFNGLRFQSWMERTDMNPSMEQYPATRTSVDIRTWKMIPHSWHALSTRQSPFEMLSSSSEYWRLYWYPTPCLMRLPALLVAAWKTSLTRRASFCFEHYSPVIWFIENVETKQSTWDIWVAESRGVLDMWYKSNLLNKE